MTAVMEETKTEKPERTLTLNDRCDAGHCGAAALVKVSGVNGELFFCGHHYNKYENSPQMNEFAFEIVDERWSMFNENRLKEDNE
jgi:hypothetical protein